MISEGKSVTLNLSLLPSDIIKLIINSFREIWVMCQPAVRHSCHNVTSVDVCIHPKVML